MHSVCFATLDNDLLYYEQCERGIYLFRPSVICSDYKEAARLTGLSRNGRGVSKSRILLSGYALSYPLVTLIPPTAFASFKYNGSTAGIASCPADLKIRWILHASEYAAIESVQ